MNFKLKYQAFVGEHFPEISSQLIDSDIETFSIKFAEYLYKELNNSKTSGELPLMRDHICYDKGHNMFLVTEIDNRYSKYGDHKCSRCGYIESFQYDYELR